MVQYSHGEGNGRSSIMHPRTTGFASMVWKPQHATGSHPDLRQPGATLESVYADAADRPAVMRVEAYGAEAQGIWTHTHEPLEGAQFPTANGGLVFSVPETDAGDYADGYAPDLTLSEAYAVFTPKTYVAFGLPDRATGGVQSCGYRAGYDSANSELVIAGTTTLGTWDTIAKVSKTAVNLEVDLEIETSGKNLIVASPDGTRFRVMVDNAGALSTSAV